MNRRATRTGEAKRVNIVFAICLQNDFIGPKGLRSDREIEGQVLHGGARSSQRILGGADETTPIDTVMEAIHGDDHTYVVYIQDEHPDDPNDPAIKAHFDFFGRHCVAGTEGAKPVGRLGEYQRLRRAQVITTDALGLVDHPPVIEAITAILTENEIDEPTQVRLMVLGGLTDVLVADCARGLNHICGVPNPYRPTGDKWKFFGQVVVPERYTFSNVPTHHTAALQAMDKVAIKILKTDTEIFQFLGVDV